MQATSSKIPFRGYYRSSSFKMAVLFTVLLGISVSILGYFGYYFSRGHYVSGTQAILDSDIIHIVAWEREGALERGLAAYEGEEGRVYLLSAPDGTRLAGNIAAVPQDISVLTEGTVLFHAPPDRRLYAARIHTFPDGRSLLLGTDVTEKAGNYRLMAWLAGLSILFMLMVILTSFAISTFVVNRTGLIAKTAKTIMDTGDLTQRIRIDSRWDDLGYMADILNGLLARIEELMQGVRTVSDNIAHDLRTPLTRLRNRLEELQKSPALAGDAGIRALCDDLVGEADHILATFGALLRIARIETGREKTHFAPVQMDALVRDVNELYEPLAEEKGITVAVDVEPFVFHGDRDLLFQAFANMIDNAIKFTPAGGTIRIGLRDGVFSVTDTGPGVPEGEQERIFRRFYRGESSRHAPGNGLGLSLVSAVAGLHDAQVRARNANPGLCVSMEF